MDGGRTRLIERVRVRFGEGDKPWTALTLPFIGFGVFLTMRKQMLGIRDRAERRAGAPIAETGEGTEAELGFPPAREADLVLNAAV